MQAAQLSLVGALLALRSRDALPLTICPADGPTDGPEAITPVLLPIHNTWVKQ